MFSGTECFGDGCEWYRNCKGGRGQ
jgi:hypothetical protein